MPDRIRDLVAGCILVFVTLAIAAVDVVTGKDVTVWALYLVPIALAAAVGGLRFGLLFSLLASSLIALVGTNMGSPYPTGICFVIGLCNETLAFAGTAGAVAVIRQLLRERERLRSMLPDPEHSAA